MRRGAVLGGSSLMSSAWRGTDVILPPASVSVTLMWSALSAWADAAGEPMTNNVATSSARPINHRPLRVGRCQRLAPGSTGRGLTVELRMNGNTLHPLATDAPPRRLRADRHAG